MQKWRVRTIGTLAGLFQNGLLGLLDDQCLETGIVDKRAPPCRIAVLKQKHATIKHQINLILLQIQLTREDYICNSLESLLQFSVRSRKKDFSLYRRDSIPIARR